MRINFISQPEIIDKILSDLDLWRGTSHKTPEAGAA